ncbi:unnamed protein product, partial [Ascophyllum nodosum]
RSQITRRLVAQRVAPAARVILSQTRPLGDGGYRWKRCRTGSRQQGHVYCGSRRRDIPGAAPGQPPPRRSTARGCRHRGGWCRGGGRAAGNRQARWSSPLQPDAERPEEALEIAEEGEQSRIGRFNCSDGCSFLRHDRRRHAGPDGRSCSHGGGCKQVRCALSGPGAKASAPGLVGRAEGGRGSWGRWKFVPKGLAAEENFGARGYDVILPVSRLRCGVLLSKGYPKSPLFCIRNSGGIP